ncbi:uncharacterized protein B0P05DRAFT_522426 [Gilbertella persicaria]|uniref:uncharacterized protein n=1 Tax=Gilbertella persicaria TaxID=101096 RepID=UPI00221F748C|nr:uncharacterized protein B0P05DRAFT_522426 [Gilbertella persicaria]KAI8097875.1 hypothetical protein B0P05DRAFT_522426 [Gilbertella persicaria]
MALFETSNSFFFCLLQLVREMRSVSLLLFSIGIFFILFDTSQGSSVTQQVDNENGPFTNKITGTGSSANTYSKSVTEVTTSDGQTIRKEYPSSQKLAKSSSNMPLLVPSFILHALLLSILFVLFY